MTIHKTPLDELVEAIERSHGRKLTAEEINRANDLCPRYHRSGPQVYPIDGRITGREATDY